mmetsp:Transcript_46699/g.111147  ORF Transcript_46699/g.111147 Transcript_46699/m.111147 type:complete len:209 (+) Transcript_46699:132-758(+)
MILILPARCLCNSTGQTISEKRGLPSSPAISAPLRAWTGFVSSASWWQLRQQRHTARIVSMCTSRTVSSSSSESSLESAAAPLRTFVTSSSGSGASGTISGVKSTSRTHGAPSLPSTTTPAASSTRRASRMGTEGLSALISSIRERESATRPTRSSPEWASQSNTSRLIPVTASGDESETSNVSIQCAVSEFLIVCEVCFVPANSATQ